MTPVEPKSARDKAAHSGTVRDVLPRPCIVSIREGEHEPGWLRRRFADSFKVAGQVWARHTVRHSMLRWSGLALLLLAATVVYLAQTTTPMRGVVGAVLSFTWAGAWLLFIGFHLGVGECRDHAGCDDCD